MRAAIYARFSSHLQDERSIEDQVRICTERAEAEGWTVAGVHTDYAISGAIRERPGLNALLAAADDGMDIILTESLDRISRDLEDIAGIYKRIIHADCRLFTLSEGEISEIHIGLKGTMAQLFRKDLAEKIRRGKRGRVAQGRVPGGRAFGYRLVRQLRSDGELERGLLEIDPDQAEIVRRIYTEFLGNRSPRAIAERLNAEGIPGPTGGLWRASTINGDRIRANGILQNELYIGQIVYNRTRRTYHPITRKRVIKPNPPEQWIRQEALHLAIIDQALWDAVTARRQRFDGVRGEHQRRPRKLLSGLVRCASCGGAYNIVGQGRWACGRSKDGRGCEQRRTIANHELERRTLTGLREQLLSPQAMEAWLAEAKDAAGRQAKEDRRAATAASRRKAEAERKIARLTAAIAMSDEVLDPLVGALRQARHDLAKAEAALADISTAAEIALHPAIIADYRKQVEGLQELLADPERTHEAREAIRALIGTVSIAVNKDGETDIRLTGHLTQLVETAKGKSPVTVVPLR